MKSATTVVIPCFNAEQYLASALDSVCRQTVPVKEIILVDDGSRIPVERPDRWNGPHLEIVRIPNQGPAAARNVGLQKATGEFVALLDADDVWHPRKIEAQESLLQATPDAIASYTRCQVGPDLFPFGPYPPHDVSSGEFLVMLWYHSFFPPSTLMFRTSAVQTVGLFDETLKGPEDIEYYFRLRTLGRFVQVPEPLCAYRQHPTQFTANLYRKLVAWKRARKIMIERYGDDLVAAGLRADRLWDAYRNELLVAFYRRQFSAARPLLWDYWRDHPTDWHVLFRALVSLLPEGLVRRVRGAVPMADPAADYLQDGTGRWRREFQRLAPALIIPPQRPS